MPCDPIYGPDRAQFGVICSRRRGGKVAPCYLCGQPSSALCDGRDCDKPICRRPSCSVSMPGIDTDYCQACAQAPQLPVGCSAAGPALDCRGPILKGGTCLQHEVVFDHWLKNCGGYERVYSRTDLDREAKRSNFRDWVFEHMREVADVLRRRGMQPATNNVIRFDRMGDR